MAKYEVTHTCLHTQTHVLFGKHKDRDSKIEWLKTTLCTDCYHAKLAQEREDASKQCHNWSKGEGLSPLLGSERQIAWAETLRASMLGNVRIEADRIKTQIEEHKAGDDPAVQAAWAAILDSLTWISQQDQAKFWIDNRDSSGLALILLCPYIEPHLATISPAAAKRLVAKREAEGVEASKRAEELAKKSRIDDRRELDRKRLVELTGNDKCQLEVKTEANKQRVYIGGYPALVTYYATGDRYHAEGTIETAKGVVADIATRLGVTDAEAMEALLAFCRDLCGFWNIVRIN